MRALIKQYQTVILLAIFLRLLLMPFLFHPDLKSHYFHAQFLSQGVVNIYDHIAENKDILPYKDTFNYPPLTYLALGTYYTVASPVLGEGFSSWMADWSETWFTSAHIFRYLFILKLPYLALDLACGLLLAGMLAEKYRKIALFLWFFNPVTLYTIYALGTFDIVPTFLTILAVHFYQKQRYAATGISLGLGAALKLFPFLFLPFLVLPLLLERKIKPALLVGLSAVTIFLLSILPFFSGFLATSQSGLTQKVLISKLTIGSIGIPYFFLLYGGLLVLMLVKNNLQQQVSLFIVLLMFGTAIIAKIHPQWMLWSVPFIVLLAAQNLKLLFFFIPLTLYYFLLVLSFEDRFLTLGLFSPILPNIYDVGFFERTLFAKFDKQTLLLAGQAIATCSFIGFIVYYLKTLRRTDE